jgi:general nucleoside transport system permease protein
MNDLIIITFLASTLRATTPLLLTALGGLFSERAGVVNIALEGLIIFGALAAAVTTQLIEAPYIATNPTAKVPYAPWIGVLVGVIVSSMIAWIHAVISIRYKADQVISGTAINLMAVGIPALVLTGLYNNTANTDTISNRLPLWAGFSPLIYLAFLLVPVVWYVVYRTPFGLRLRSVGEHPEAADSVGINVRQMRYYAVILSGVFAGLAGAYLSIGNFNQFIVNMSGGRGFIALAALIFGKWNPWGVLGATLLFGAFDALKIQLGGSNLLPPTVVESIPFILTMMVLAGFIGRSVAPKATGKAFEK